MAAGMIVAVKVNNTAPGPTTMTINALAPINCAPNGGGPMLQGDLHKANVVLFFYDGINLYFAGSALKRSTPCRRRHHSWRAGTTCRRMSDRPPRRP